MERTLPRPLDWRLVGIVSLAALLAVPNVMLMGESLRFIAGREYVWDWWLFEQAAERIGTGTMYEWGAPAPLGDHYEYRYSPIMAYLMAPMTWAGVWFWRALHLAVLALLPWRLALATLLLWPFWFDVAHANVMTFVAVSGFLALRGNRYATWAYFALTLLVPRPLMIPLAAWILWKRPEWRVPVAGLVAGYSVLTLATGEGFAFLASLVHAGDMVAFAYNWGPSQFVGAWWMLVGVPLAGWLTYRGHVGWAGLAVSPYVLPYYVLILGWELLGHRGSEGYRKGFLADRHL